nr:XRE family transcriptional regulator [Schwartzia sp. (in: firmicutes)]
ALSIAMKLSRVETEHLLYYGRVNKLYAKNNWDKVIIYALNKKLSVERTNCILSDLSLTPLLG